MEDNDEYVVKVREDNPENWRTLRDLEHAVNINVSVRWLKKQRGRVNRISNWWLSPKEIAYKREILKLITKKLKEWEMK